MDQSSNKKWFSTSRIILFAISCIIPLFVIVKGFMKLCNYAIMTPCMILSLFILPLGAIALLSACNFNPLRTVWRIIADVVVLAALVFLVLFCFLIGPIVSLDHYEQNEVAAQYTEVHDKVDAMPKLDEIGTPQKMDYFVFQREEYIFCWHTYTLVCTYDSSEYEQQKALIEQNYVFQAADLEEFGYTCFPYDELDGFTFRALSCEGEYKYLQWPKYMAFIGTNDETRQIVYMYYDDSDIDYFDGTLEEFIDKNCGWKHFSKDVRKKGVEQ